VLSEALFTASILPLAVRKGELFSALAELTVTATAGVWSILFSFEELPQLVTLRTTKKSKLVYKNFILKKFDLIKIGFINTCKVNELFIRQHVQTGK
jgi:hypothetical protein